MSGKKLSIAILGALLMSTTVCSQGVSAAEIYELDPVVVTAQRVENRDLQTPASVEVIDREEIEKSGAEAVHLKPYAIHWACLPARRCQMVSAWER